MYPENDHWRTPLGRMLLKPVFESERVLLDLEQELPT